MAKRLYLPTAAELLDRLSILQLKAIYIPENRKEYAEEMRLIRHDLKGLIPCSPRLAHALLVLSLANRVIWENESKARQGGSEQDKLLKFTHSINGVRARAKNVIAEELGGRKDLKTDCLAADLPKEFGAWDVSL